MAVAVTVIFIRTLSYVADDSPVEVRSIDPSVEIRSIDLSC